MGEAEVINWPGLPRPTDPFQGWVLAGDIPEPKYPPFVIGNDDVPILHDKSTVIYGRPEAGKSMAALSMAHSLMTGEPFMGYPVREKHQVAFWVLDSGQVAETKDRIARSGKSSILNRLLLCARRPGVEEKEWEREARQLSDAGVTFLFIDNLARLKGRDRDRSVRRDEDIDPVLENLRVMEAFGIGVALLHHAGKPGEDGAPKSSPLGATSIEAWARHFIRIDALQDKRDRSSWNRSLISYGNAVRTTPPPIPFEITDTGLVSVAPDDADKGKAKREADAATRAKRADIREFVLQKYPTQGNKSEVGRRIKEAGLEGSARTATNRLGDGGYGLVWNGQRWEPGTKTA